MKAKINIKGWGVVITFLLIGFFIGYITAYDDNYTRQVNICFDIVQDYLTNK